MLSVTQYRKNKKPFIRPDVHKVKVLKAKWRRPKRKTSKPRRQFKGKVVFPNPGYQLPKELKNKTTEGLEIVRVSNIKELGNYDPKKHILIIARIGKKKRLELIEKALSKGFKVYNIKDPKAYVDKIKAEREKEVVTNKSRREKVKKKKAEMIEEAKKESEAKESKEEKKDVGEEKNSEEKKGSNEVKATEKTVKVEPEKTKKENIEKTESPKVKTETKKSTKATQKKSEAKKDTKSETN